MQPLATLPDLPCDFDADEYLLLNPDVVAAGVDAALHYRTFGMREKRAYKRRLTTDIYDRDGLRSVHNHDFIKEPSFQAAYQRGVQAAGTDYAWQWRVHVGLWAAGVAAKLPGDFVECGVNRGFLSSAIMTLLNWNATGRTFYLLDTFAGIDPRHLSGETASRDLIARNAHDIKSGFYTFDVEAVRRNFSEWHLARIIVGPVPDTLEQIVSSKIAFVHLDMNCPQPEIDAAQYLWPRMVTGAVMLLDDYAYQGFGAQKIAMDGFAMQKGVPILSLPTGQGLLIKPPG